MKFKTIAIGIIIFVVMDLCLFWIISNGSNLKAFPSIISSFYSKEFCSCYFVVGGNEDFCHNYARQWVPISDFKLDNDKKRVIVSGLGRTNSAQFLDNKQGCVLQELD
jgi:hypothetical protein